MHWAMFIFFNHENGRNGIIDPFFQDRFVCYNLNICHLLTLNYNLYLLGSCFGMPKVSHEEAASAKVVSKRWPKVPFHGASVF
jgi:hypothetical protein